MRGTIQAKQLGRWCGGWARHTQVNQVEIGVGLEKMRFFSDLDNVPKRHPRDLLAELVQIQACVMLLGLGCSFLHRQRPPEMQSIRRQEAKPATREGERVEE